MISVKTILMRNLNPVRLLEKTKRQHGSTIKHIHLNTQSYVLCRYYLIRCSFFHVLVLKLLYQVVLTPFIRTDCSIDNILVYTSMLTSTVEYFSLFSHN